MIQLLSYNYDKRTETVLLTFSHNQKAVIHRFGETLYTETTYLIVKYSLIEIKEKLLREGMDADLSEFVGRDFKIFC